MHRRVDLPWHLADSVQVQDSSEAWDSLHSSWFQRSHNSLSHSPAATASWDDHLSTLKRYLVSNPVELHAAHECMVHVGSLARDFTFRGPDSAQQGLVVTTNYDQVLRTLLRTQRAAQSVAERSLRRLIWAAREHGLPQREIAGLIERPQTHVFRQLRAIDDDPTLLSLSPRELLDHHRSGKFDRATLLKLLAAFPYEAGEFPTDEPEWGYVPGSWDELSQMTIEGEISRSELDVIVSGARARSDAYG